MSWQGTDPTRRHLVFLFGLIPVLVTSVLALYRPALLARLDAATYDTLARWAPTRLPTDRVVIVDVDERSLSTIGQWPWRRDVVARLIACVRDLGASTVALDIVFAEPDRSNASDDVLAATLRGGRVVMGYAMTFDRTAGRPAGCVMHPVGLAVLQAGEDTGEAPYFRATSAVCSLPVLARAAGASGFLNAAPDADGILRRVPLLVELGGSVYPSLALAAVAQTVGGGNPTLRIATVNASSLTFDTRRVPLDGKSNLLVRYRGKKKTFSYVSAADVINGQLPAGMLRGKIAFVGTTALGTREVVATPLDTLFAGVEVQATVADNLLEQDPFRRSPLGTTLESAAVLAAGIAVAALVATTGLLPGLLGSVMCLLALWSGAAWLLSTSGLSVSPLPPTLGVMTALAVMTAATSTLDRRRAERAGRQKTNAQRLMVQTLLSLTETRDAETGRHSRRTQQYARLLASQLSTSAEFRDYLTPERVDLLSSLAPLHDIGKVGVPDHILNKPGALTAEEVAEMRKHPVLGRDVILKAEQQVGVPDDAILAMAKDIVYTHHERWDGTGYPCGLRNTEIPVVGRVMAVVDVYDATLSRTLYGPSMPHDAAVAFIVRGKGTHFDPAVVDAFVRVAPLFRTVSSKDC